MTDMIIRGLCIIIGFVCTGVFGNAVKRIESDLKRTIAWNEQESDINTFIRFIHWSLLIVSIGLMIAPFFVNGEVMGDIVPLAVFTFIIAVLTAFQSTQKQAKR